MVSMERFPVLTQSETFQDTIQKPVVTLIIACTLYSTFLYRHRILVRKLLKQGYTHALLKSSFLKFHKKHKALLAKYGVPPAKHIHEAISFTEEVSDDVSGDTSEEVQNISQNQNSTICSLSTLLDYDLIMIRLLTLCALKSSRCATSKLNVHFSYLK